MEAGEEAARFREGQSVKLVFRPEDACLSLSGELPAGARRLTNGVVEEKHFVGAYERLTVRLDLVERRPQEGTPQLYEVTINTPESKLGLPVFVTRPKPEASANALHRRPRRRRPHSLPRPPHFASAPSGGENVDTGSKRFRF